MIPLRTLGHRAPLLWIVIPYIGGVAAARHGPEFSPLVLLTAGLGAVAASLLMAIVRPRLWAPLLVAGVALTGYANCIRLQRLPPGWREMPAREARFVLQVERVFEPQNFPPSHLEKPPHPRSSKKTAAKKAPLLRASGTGIVIDADRHLRELVGQRIYYSLALPPGRTAPGRSAVVRAIGVLETVPRESNADSFDAFLSGNGVSLRLGRGQFIELVRPQSGYREFCDALAARMTAILGGGLESRPDLSSVYRAMMLGNKKGAQAGP
jgi:competence protein ComEC